MFDITERRQAEEHLRAAEERYRAIVEHVPAAIYVDVPDGSMQSRYVSPQIEQIMGCTPEEFIAQPELWLELMPDERQRAEMRETYVEAIRERRPSWTGEYLIRHPDGREVWVHDETTFVTDEHGEPLFLQGVMYDVTERKLAEQRPSRQRAARARGGRTPARDRRDEEHLPRGGLARAPEPAHLDPGPRRSRSSSSRCRCPIRKTSSAGWRRTPASSTGSSRTCSTSTASPRDRRRRRSGPRTSPRSSAGRWRASTSSASGRSSCGPNPWSFRWIRPRSNASSRTW